MLSPSSCPTEAITVLFLEEPYSKTCCRPAQVFFYKKVLLLEPSVFVNTVVNLEKGSEEEDHATAPRYSNGGASSSGA
jgi:hypothetical protein